MIKIKQILLFTCIISSEIYAKQYFNEDYNIVTVANEQETDLEKKFKNLKQIKNDLNFVTNNNDFVCISPGLKTLPNSIKEELQALSSHDWIKRYESFARANGINIPITQWPEQERKKLFSNFSHYEFPEYIKMLKVFPEYGTRMQEFAKQLENVDSKKSKLHADLDNLDVRINDRKLCQYIETESKIHKEIPNKQEQKRNTIKALDNLSLIFSGQKKATAKDITNANLALDTMQRSIANHHDLDIANTDFKNLVKAQGIDYSVYEFRMQDNQKVLVRVTKDINKTENTQNNITFIGSVWNSTNKSFSMVYEKQGEYIEIPLNSTLLSRFTQTNRYLFLNSEIAPLTATEISKLHQVMSVIIDFIPIANTIKSTAEMISGIDYITGQKLTSTERAFAALGMLPIISWTKKGAKFFNIASKLKAIAKRSKFVSLLQRGAFKFKNIVKNTKKLVNSKNFWDMPSKGKIINGRHYTKHALERMAPKTPQVLAELELRAIKRGYPRESLEFIKYVQPRNIPPLVVENAIQTGTKLQGKYPLTWEYKTNDISVIVNEAGDVISVIPQRD